MRAGFARLPQNPRPLRSTPRLLGSYYLHESFRPLYKLSPNASATPQFRRLTFTNSFDGKQQASVGAGSHEKTQNYNPWTSGEIHKSSDGHESSRSRRELPSLSRLRPEQDARNDPKSWILLLDRYLPQNLRISIGQTDETIPPQEAPLEVLTIVGTARRKGNAEVDILSHMGLKYGRWKAALSLIDILLRRVASKITVQSPQKLPSNISWPYTPLERMCRAPIELDHLLYEEKQIPGQWHYNYRDPRYSSSMPQEKDVTMTQIWYTVGNLIVEAANLPDAEAQAALAVVYQILAQIHSLDLVPENVYAHVPSNYTSYNHRPPIIHLLSSRILTTMSDAVWRAHTDDLIEQAVKQGAEYKDIGRDPPGGRFRLKVRPLGPEVWLEFVLWCCAEGGFIEAGLRIIEKLRQQKSPWFSVSWTDERSSSTSSHDIDWEKVKVRHGGSVGQSEGYSGVRPFVEMEPRTISTEVVLSLSESLINSVNPGLSQRGLSVQHVLDLLKDLISFLEPHTLPLEYFDYLAVRMLQTESFDPIHRPLIFEDWLDKLAFFQSLESTRPRTKFSPSLTLESILEQSEFYAGLLHQNLENFVNTSDIRKALDAFQRVQQLVDRSKLQSITHFLNETVNAGGPLHSPTGQSSQALDYTDSHGKLPNYRLGAFLNLVMDAKLSRLGDWMLHTDDIDGPVIPLEAYGDMSIATTVARFAALTKDSDLLDRLKILSQNSRRHASVNFLRSLVNAEIMLGRFSNAEAILNELVQAVGGGYHPSNVAHLAAAVLLLESQTVGFAAHTAKLQLAQAHELLNKIVKGHYDAVGSDFTRKQRSLFKRQVACVLRMMSYLPANSFGPAAMEWLKYFPPGNEVDLPVSIFNVLLSAIVETRGAKEGMRMWDIFCQDPRTTQSSGSGLFDEHVASSAEEVGFRDIKFDSNIPLTAQKLSQRPKFGDALVEPNASNGRNPITVPDLRTLRLIVRGALGERRIRLQQDRAIWDQQDVLQWAVQFYRAFGTSQRVIELEIQQPLGDDGSEELSMAEAQAVYEENLRAKGVTMSRDIGISKQFSGNTAAKGQGFQ